MPRHLWGILLGLLTLGAGSAARAGTPALVVQITVDQLPASSLWQLQDRLGQGGFRRFLEEGLQYTNARYQYATTFTATGHAALFTGAPPCEHGLVANNWLDPRSGQRVYCVEDSLHTLLDAPTKRHAGTSPANLRGTTWGDELVLASGGRSRVFSVSLKDRGAILPGGHSGKSFWYSSSVGGFVSSTYYYQALPDWVARWNQADPTSRYRGGRWELLSEPATYRRQERDDRACERSAGTLGRVFPHPLPEDPGMLRRTLAYTPFADELTVDFAEELLRREELGRGADTDVLALSLSASDYIGHAFGPYSLEVEDQLLRLDALLGRFFAFLDEHVGLERTLIVLSSDHGVDVAPECWEAEAEAPMTGRLVPEDFLEVANRALRERYGLQADPVLAFWSPSVYLDRAVVEQAGLARQEVEVCLASTLRQWPGIAHAYTRTQLENGWIPDDPIAHLLARSFDARRSGDVLLVQEPLWYLYDDPQAYAAMHGSPYAYDRHVPILALGAGIEPGVCHRPVSPASIAPTLSLVLGTRPPSGSGQDLLTEMLENDVSRK